MEYTTLKRNYTIANGTKEVLLYYHLTSHREFSMWVCVTNVSNGSQVLEYYSDNLHTHSNSMSH